MPGQSLTPNTPCDGQILLTYVGGEITVPADPGDVSIDVPDAPIDIFLKRGKITATPLARRGEESPVGLGFSFYVLDIGDPLGLYITVLDAIWRFPGKFADTNLLSTLSGTDLVACTFTFTIDGAATGDTARTVRVPFVVMRASFAEGRPYTASATGTGITVRPELI